MANRQFLVYPRRRWVGFDLSIDQLGILEVAHGLLRHTFIKFCLLHTPVPKRAAVPAPAVGAMAIENGDEGDDEEGANAGAGAGDGNPEEMAAHAEQEFDYAQQNEKHRRISLQYVQTKPFWGKIMILCKVFEPFRVLLNELMHISSDSWEWRQAAIEAKYLMGKGVEERKYRVTIAAMHELEHKFAKWGAGLSAAARMGMPPWQVHESANAGIGLPHVEQGNVHSRAVARAPP